MSSNEDDQLGELKDWWQRNGKPLLTGGLLALVVVSGWQLWHKYQTNQSQGASVLYQQLLETTLTPDGKPDVARVADLANKLKSEYAGTAYSQFGGLFVAKVAVDNGKLDDAAVELKAIVDKPANATLGEVARQRLAQVLAAQGKVDDALKLLEGDSDKAFQASQLPQKHPDQDQDFGYPNSSINPLRRLTLRCTASSKTPARGSTRLNQCLARVIPV